MCQARKCARVNLVNAFLRTPGRDCRNEFPGVEQRDISMNLFLPRTELHLTYLLSYSVSNILNKSLFIYVCSRNYSFSKVFLILPP